jgi:phosphoglycolate phosphatase-like HAD superfamily hydrolase
MGERQYLAYLDALSHVKYDRQLVNAMSKSDFRIAKQSLTSQEFIALKSGLKQVQIDGFIRFQKQVVNLPLYMKNDQLFPETTDALKMANDAGMDLVLLTMRRESELELAFENTLTKSYFQESNIYCLSNDYQKNSDSHDKTLLLEKALFELPPVSETWMIGDTEADILAAKMNNIKVIAVLSGSRNYERLKIYEPNFIANNILEAVKFILTPSQGLG